ncbi:MAG: hypothetical protein ACKO96_28520 [Flammeovirgaceae bacterium]
MATRPTSRTRFQRFPSENGKRVRSLERVGSKKRAYSARSFSR